MADKKRSPKDQLLPRANADPLKLEGTAKPIASFDEVTGEMISETTSILTDFYRQYIGVYGQTTDKPGDAIFINWDPVLKEQSFKQWAQYDLYWYLEQDPQIRAILSAAKVNVVGLPWRVKPYLKGKEKKPSVTNQAIADFIQQMFEGIDTFPQHLYDLMDALPKGFSFSEIIWQLRDGYWTIDHLMNRPQRRIQFDAVTRQPRVRTAQNPFYGDRVEPGKYIVHRVSTNWENPFGDAFDQSLYWAWQFKRTATKFYLRHLDVGASSSPIVQVPPQASDTMKTEAMNVAEMIHNGSFGYMPDNFKLLWAESSKAGEISNSYERFIRLMDDQMTKAVKGQLLTTEGASSMGTGSRSMGQTHKETEDSYDTFRAKSLAASVNKYLVRFGVDYNFATVEGYPKFTYEVEEQEDLVQASTVLVNLVKALPDYDFDIDQISEKFNYNLTKKEKNEPLNPENIEPANAPTGNEFSKMKTKKLTKVLQEFAESIESEDTESKERIDELERQKADTDKTVKHLEQSLTQLSKENRSMNIIQRMIQKLIDKDTVVNVEAPIVNVPAPVVTVEHAKPQQMPNIIVNVPEQAPPVVNVTVEDNAKELIIEKDNLGGIRRVVQKIIRNK